MPRGPIIGRSRRQIATDLRCDSPRLRRVSSKGAFDGSRETDEPESALGAL